MDPKMQQHWAQEHSEQRQREREEARKRIDKGEKAWEESRGVLSVVDAVRDQEFPATAQQLSEAVGDREVFVSETDRFALRRVLGKLKGETDFPTLKDFQTIVQRHWDGIRNLTVPPEQWPPGRPR